MSTSKLLYSRKEAAQLLSLSLRMIDHLISEHKLTIRKAGKRVLVLADSLKEYASPKVERQTHEKMPASKSTAAEQILSQVLTAKS